MQIIYMVMECLNFYQQTDSNGLTLNIWIQINTTKIVQKVVFSKLILNIQNNNMNCIMIILWLQIKQKCCLNIN